MCMPQPCLYKETSFRDLKKLKRQIDILLITVTQIETKSLHDLLKPLPETASILKGSHGILTYYIGVFGRYKVCHVESKMGSVGVGASLATIQKAIGDWNPKILVMMGIAFGKDVKSQNIGDVLLSKRIQQYQHKKITKNGVEQDRNDKHICNPTLFDRFSSYQNGWSYPITESLSSAVHTGDILSGELLIDNEKVRNDLFGDYPEAIGGEMEGLGVANAAAAEAKAWIVVKGICDYADGNKGDNKEQRQHLAAGAAASLCEHIFNHGYVFEYFKIKSLPETPTTQDVQEPDINKNVHLDDVEIPKIPGITDTIMQTEDNAKLTRAFFGQTPINRFRIGLKLGLIDAEETKTTNKDAIAAKILIRAQQQHLFAQLWTMLFNEEKEPNPFK